MSAPKKLVFGSSARKKILDGAVKLEAAVASTLGPNGRTVLIYDGTANLRTTKDGVSVARAIGFKDQHEDAGARIVLEAANKTNTVAGDGTTTATIITVELMKRGNDLVNLGLNATSVKRGYDAAMNDVLQLFSDHVVGVRDEKDIYAIASVSSNADDEIVKNVSDAFIGIGEGGVVSITDSFSRSGKTVVQFSDGLEFDRGFLSSICVNTASETFEAEDPRFLLFESPVRDYSELTPFVQWANENKLPLIVIAPTYDDDVIGSFYENVDKGIIRGTLIMTPGYAKSTVDEWTKDIAVQTSATIVKSTASSSDFNVLGKAKYVQVRANKTTITEPLTDEDRFFKRVEELKKDSVSDEKTELELTSIKERLARMTGGIATIKIGANSELELREKKDRYEDAVNAVRSAIRGGISPGCGSPLIKIQRKILHKVPITKDPAFDAGYEAFVRSITKPAERLIESTGKNPYEIMSKVASRPPEYGYDARLGKITDLVATGIVDPALVTVSAIKYATSVAGTFVTTNTTVTNDVDSLSMQPVDEILENM
jgi:chaperonin GroEL